MNKYNEYKVGKYLPMNKKLDCHFWVSQKFLFSGKIVCSRVYLEMGLY